MQGIGGIMNGCWGDIENYLKNEKLEQVVEIIKSWNALVNISGKILWSIPTGPPIYDAHQSPNLEDDEHNSSRQQNNFYIDCGDDWQLYIYDKNSKAELCDNTELARKDDGRPYIIHQNRVTSSQSQASCLLHNGLVESTSRSRRVSWCLLILNMHDNIFAFFLVPQKLPFSVEELIGKTPHVSEDGVLIGSKNTTVFLVDPETGDVISTFKSDATLSSEQSSIILKESAPKRFDLCQLLLLEKFDYNFFACCLVYLHTPNCLLLEFGRRKQNKLNETVMVAKVQNVTPKKKKPRKSGKSRVDANTEKIMNGFQFTGSFERKIGKLLVSDKEIGKGSNGTIILEGVYDARRVAVKHIYDQDFVYIALERCICSLHELVHLLKFNCQWRSLRISSYGSPMASGLAHLHELGIIHRDLKPQNVLIRKDRSIVTAKVSDMGISKRLPADMSCLTKRATGKSSYGSSGWQAPEQLRKERQTRAVDLFSFGCVLFFCITCGRHPFGDTLECDVNIVNDRKDLFLIDYIPEAFDLITNLIPEFRKQGSIMLAAPDGNISQVNISSASGLAHLHELGIIHRDLKPQNVLIRKDRSITTAKVSDIGYGSLGWQAPEQLRNERQTRAVDLVGPFHTDL
ncbi:PUG domain-containing protein [Tanacetum coccineum]